MLRIRVDDPGQLLAEHEGKTVGAHLLLGVGGAASLFHPARVAATDSKGRDYQILIPFDTPVKLVINSARFQLSDAVGQPVARAATAVIPVTVAAGQQAPAIRLTVTGINQ